MSIGQTDQAFYAPEEAQGIREKDLAVMQAEERVVYEAEATSAGRKRLYQTTKAAFRDEEGRVLGILGISRDITEQRQAEAELRRLSMVARKTTSGVIITDAEQRVEWANEAFVRLTGYGLEEISGKPLENLLLGPGTDPDTRIRVQTHLHRGEGFREEIRNHHKEGAVYWVEVEVTPVYDENGVIVQFIGIQQEITERHEAQNQIARHMERLAALRSIDLAINASLDLQLTLNVVLEQVRSQLGVHGASVLLLNPHTLTLECAARMGEALTSLSAPPYRLSQGLLGTAVLERRTVSASDLPQSMRGKTTPVGYYAVPLVAKGQVKGVLEVYRSLSGEADVEWLEFLETLAGQAAIAIDNASLFQDLQRSNLELRLAYDATIEGWSRALDLRDKETEGHSQRVAEMTLRLARMMGVDEAEQVSIRRGALLHDIGKLGVPDAVLLKPGQLTPEERQSIERHALYAYEMLAPIAFLRPAIDIPYCHHEKWDGTGYPRGLKGEEIPLSARIFAVADVWDALRSDRPYRPGWPEEKVREYISEQSGTHFDPRVVLAFLSLDSLIRIKFRVL